MVAYTVQDIVNQAPRDIGYPTPIGSIQHGSKASRVALQLYGQTRDTLLQERDWDFAKRLVSLGAPVKTAPPGDYGGGGWNTTYPMAGSGVGSWWTFIVNALTADSGPPVTGHSRLIK